MVEEFEYSKEKADISVGVSLNINNMINCNESSKIDEWFKIFYNDIKCIKVNNMENNIILFNEVLDEIINNKIDVPFVLDKVFKEKEEFKQEVNEKLEKYHIVADTQIEPQAESTTRKFAKQYLSTDTGVEIKIPMEQYQDGEHIESITNPDGSISILIKNVGHITSK